MLLSLEQRGEKEYINCWSPSYGSETAASEGRRDQDNWKQKAWNTVKLLEAEIRYWKGTQNSYLLFSHHSNLFLLPPLPLMHLSDIISALLQHYRCKYTMLPPLRWISPSTSPRIAKLHLHKRQKEWSHTLSPVHHTPRSTASTISICNSLRMEMALEGGQNL